MKQRHCFRLHTASSQGPIRGRASGSRLVSALAACRGWILSWPALTIEARMVTALMTTGAPGANRPDTGVNPRT
jgi:hypothetical protein